MASNRGLALMLLFIFLCPFFLQAQSIKLSSHYYQGKDIYLELKNFSTKDSVIRFISDRIDTVNTDTRFLNKKENSLEGIMLAGQCKFPGLQSIRVESVAKGGALSEHLDSFLYVQSPGQAQLEYPRKISSFLSYSLTSAQIDTVKHIHDSMLVWQDTLRSVFSALKFDTIKLKNKKDSIQNNIDSFYVYLNKLAANFAKEKDSGYVTDISYIYDFPKGLTLVSWMKNRSIGADTTSLYGRHVLAKNILDSIQQKWVEDSLIYNANSIAAKWKPWLNKVILDTLGKDHLLNFIREDNFLTDELLKSYSRDFKPNSSFAWIGFASKKEDRLLFLIKLVGTKKNRKE